MKWQCTYLRSFEYLFPHGDIDDEINTTVESYEKGINLVYVKFLDELSHAVDINLESITDMESITTVDIVMDTLIIILKEMVKSEDYPLDSMDDAPIKCDPTGLNMLPFDRPGGVYYRDDTKKHFRLVFNLPHVDKAHGYVLEVRPVVDLM